MLYINAKGYHPEATHASLFLAAPTLRMVSAGEDMFMVSPAVFSAPLQRQQLDEDDAPEPTWRSPKELGFDDFMLYDRAGLYEELRRRFGESIEATRLQLYGDTLRDELEHLLFL
uniref:Uncharacterized protein n=1 Tax=Mycena chlorophos TaxID=658473 RepID=A0ABQ0LTQ4_MYCCL|nr:predicted protein [Mycena chlorophos]